MSEKLKKFFRLAVARVLFWQLRRLIKQQQIKVVAVAGSVGKTTTKLAIAKVLEAKYPGKVLAHSGNFNMEISVPLSVFDLPLPRSLMNPLAWVMRWWQIEGIINREKYPYKYVVVELGIDRVGQMGFYASQLKPDVGVLTAIAPEHMEYFGNIETVGREEFGIIPASKVALLNGEDTEIAKLLQDYHEPIQTYGVKNGVFHFKDIQRSHDLKLSGELSLAEGKIRVKTQIISATGLAALAAAAGVGEELGLDFAEIKQGIELFAPVSGRMQLLLGKNDSLILDDSYNSSPNATKAAIETLLELQTSGRKIAILGSMNELGETSAKAHRALGKQAAKVDLLVTIGKEAGKHLVAGAAENGEKADHIHSFDSPFAAGRFVVGILQPGDVVMVKGSQNRVFSEEAVALLLAKSADRSKLVRQGTEWMKIKREQFEDADE